MFGIGGPELIVIVILALLLVGPDKLPQVAKTVGTGLRDLRRMTNLAQAELRETMDELVREVDLEDKRRAPTPADEPSLAPELAEKTRLLTEQAKAHAEAHAKAKAAGEPTPVHTPPQGPPPDGATLAVIERRRADPTHVPETAAELADPSVAVASPPVLSPAAGAVPRSSTPRRAGSAAALADAIPPAAERAPDEAATPSAEPGSEPT